MQIELTGKVVSILPEQKFNGKNGEVVKNAFVLEWFDNGYPQRLCLEVVGQEKFNKMRNAVRVDNDVLVRFNVSSREWQGRWFTSCQCFYCANVGDNAHQNGGGGGQSQQTAVTQQSKEQESDQLPF